MSGVGRLAVSARLRELGAHLRLRGESKFRARAYETAAAAVEALGPRFEILAAEGRLTEVPGIGEKLAATIDRLHRTGTTSTLDAFRAEVPPGLLAMAALPGLTLARVRRLHDELGLDSVAALEQAARMGLLQQVRGIGPQTERRLLEAIAAGRRKPPPQMILRDAQRAAHPLLLDLRATPGVSAAEVAGSVRRWKEVVTTIRLVAAAEQPGPVLDGFLRAAAIGEVLEQSATQARFRLMTGQAAELVVVPPDRWGLGLLRQTGSREHLAALEQRAAARGLRLDDLPAETEAQVYAGLGLAEIPPELREPEAAADWELDAAELATLVQIGDVRGFVHCHTTASDGRHELGQMALGARERGMAYLTITDHSPTASYAGGLSPERLAQQGAEIAALRTTAGIDILAGTESDIRADGTLDYPLEVLAGLDVVIGSIHNRFKMQGPEMTRRLVTAMGQPLFKIWGHGLGRMLLRRDPIVCDVEAVLEAARAGQAAVEVNGDPHRMDLPPFWLRQARVRGLRFVISVDAHSVADYDHLEMGVHMARRAGIRRDEVLNTLPSGAFRDAVRPRGRG
jgi:DNA polymerase (family X)